jgi:hypothetical protein
LAPIDLKSLPVLNPLTLDEIKREKISKAFDEFCKREIFTVFEEIGVEAQRVLLDKVRPERKKLDKVIMDEVLNLTEEEQLEVYRSVVDLVRSRIEMAKSGEKNVVDIDIDELVNSVLKDVERFYGIQPRRFPEDYISECPCRVIEVPNGSKVETGFDLEGPYVKIDDVKIRCSSIYEAKFIEYAVLAGKTRISIPLDEDVLRNAVEERGKLIRDAKTKIKEFLNETMVDRKLREKVRFETFRRLGI